MHSKQRCKRNFYGCRRCAGVLWLYVDLLRRSRCGQVGNPHASMQPLLCTMLALSYVVFLSPSYTITEGEVGVVLSSFVEQYFVEGLPPQQAEAIEGSYAATAAARAAPAPDKGTPRSPSAQADSDRAQSARASSGHGADSVPHSNGTLGPDMSHQTVSEPHQEHPVADGASSLSADCERSAFHKEDPSTAARTGAASEPQSGPDNEASAQLEGPVRLERIWVYPIKSCAGFAPASWPLGPNGLLYDR